MVSAGVLAGIIIGVCVGALIIAAVIAIIFHFCIFRRKKKRYEKGHVTGNGTAIVYSKPQPIDVVSSHSENVFTLQPTKPSSVYSLQNGSLHGGSMILQPAHKAPTQLSYDTTDRVFLTVPSRGQHHHRKQTKAKRVLTDEMWNKSVKTLVKKRTRSEDQVDTGSLRPVYAHPAPPRSRAASDYGGTGGGRGGSMYGSTPSLLTVHRAVPHKTKDKKTVYVIDNSTVASQSVVMAPSGRASPPIVTSQPTIARSHVSSRSRNNSHNNSFDLLDYTNQHLFDSASMQKGPGGGYYTTSRVVSPPRSPNRTTATPAFVVPAGSRTLPGTSQKNNDDVHLRWSEDMRTELEERDRRRPSIASSMASLPRKRQRAPDEHIYSYDPTHGSLTQL